MIPVEGLLESWWEHYFLLRRPTMAAKLFEYVVLHHPKTVKDAQGNETQAADAIVVPVTHVLAKNEQEVGMRAARMIPEEYVGKLDEVEILVRPFA